MPAPGLQTELKPDGIEVRTLTNASLQASIDHALSTLSPDKHGAVVAYADLDGAKLAAVAKLGDHWSIAAVADYDWASHDATAGAQVKFTWVVVLLLFMVNLA